jgi:hypothetical protein
MMIKRCSFEGCLQQAVFSNRQAVLLGKDEMSQQFAFRVYHSCSRHALYYARSSGNELYQQEKWLGWNRMFFLVTSQHLALAKHLRIHWYDAGCGAPGASTTRPYGNSSYLDDVAEIIGYRQITDDECYSPEEEAHLKRLHHEMHLVVQIFLHTGQMKPSIYKMPRLGSDWVPVEHPEDETELIFARSEGDVPEPQVDLRRCLAQYVRQLWEQDFSHAEIRRRLEREPLSSLQEMGLFPDGKGAGSPLINEVIFLINEVIEEC